MTASTAPGAAPRQFALRMWAFFAGYFVFGGVAVPFFPVWLETRGLTDTEIANCIALGLFLRVVFTPFAGVFADRAPNRRFAVLVFLVPAAFIFLLAWPATSYWPILIITGISFGLWNFALPIAEALALTGVRRFGLDYGRMRLGGSVAFIVTNLSAGALLALLSNEAIFWFIAIALFISIAVALTLPVTPPAVRALDDAVKPKDRPAWAIVSYPAALTLMLAGSLIQSSHAVLYSFGSIHWQSLGFSSIEIGAFWATGVICEIALFAWSGPAIRLVGPLGLLALGGIAAIIRWTLFATDPGLAGFLALQSLHALTFGAVYVGNQHAIARAIPEELTASAQGMFSMMTGLSMAVGTFIAGPLYEALGTEAFLVMILPAGLGLALLGAYRLYVGRRG